MNRLKKILGIIIVSIMMCQMLFNPFLVYAAESVYIDEERTMLKTSAFFDKGLEEATIPSTVRVIGACAYAQNKLKSISIPNSVEIIKQYAFMTNEIKTLVIPDSVTEIEKGAFANNKLESVKISSSIEVLDAVTFMDNNLKVVDIPSNVRLISMQCFDNNEDLSKIIIRNKDIKLAKNAIYIPAKNKDSFVIYGYPGSEAEEYAKVKGVKFKDVSEAEDDEENGTEEENGEEDEKDPESTDNENGNSEEKDDEGTQSDSKEDENEQEQEIDENDFIFGKDNYNFVNSGNYFSAYYIGDFVYNISDLYYEYFADNWRDTQWSGSCKGIADTAVLFKYGYFTKEKWQTENSAETVYQLADVSHNNKLLWLINFYQVFQGPIRSKYEKVDIEGLPEIEGFVKGLQQYYKMGKEEKLLLCEYGGDNGYGNYLGHAVAITGEPEIIDEELKEKYNHVFDEYSYRIPIYDPNYEGKMYLYIRNDFSGLANGIEDRILQYKETFYGVGENVNINLISAYSLKKGRVINIESIYENGEIADLNDNWVYNGEGFSGSAYVQNKADANMRITNSDGKYAVIRDMKKVEGDLECTVSPIIKETADGNGTITNSFITLGESGFYSVESEGENEGLDSQVMLKNSYITVKTEGKAKANFRDADSVELENTNGKAYNIKLTVNKEDSILPYNTLAISGTDAKEIKVNLTEQGTVITGDNLENLKVVAKDSRSSASKELDVGTDGKSVLIKADANGRDLLAYADIDGDGTFETALNVSNVKGKNVKNAQTGDKVEQVMICLFGAYMILIFMEFILCVKLKN